MAQTKEPNDEDYFKAIIKDFPDFPAKGILFKDIFPLFQSPEAVRRLVDHFVDYMTQSQFPKVDVIVGLDARGFLFGPMVAERLNAAFVPVRKVGKLPGPTVTASYSKEYGKDTVEMQQAAFAPNSTVFIVDDMIATGGTAKAAQDCVHLLQGHVLGFAFIMELSFLNGSKLLSKPVYSIVRY